MMSMVTKRWPAPAKVNLFLHITGQREDGYHLLQTAFQLLDFADELEFILNDDGIIQRNHVIPGVSADDDITVKAAKLLQQTSGTRQGVEICLDKKIPIGGGLGGGSSNAATTLLVLNRLWSCGLSQIELEQLGLRLGADVPVFVRGQNCWAEGIGEQLTPLELPECWYLVIKPPVSVSTAEIFRAAQLTRDSEPITIRDLTAGRIRNDCEPVVIERYPEIAAAMHWLSDYTNSYLTGTGACIFGKFDQQAQAEATLAALNDYNSRMQGKTIGQGFIAKSLNRSPLHQLLRN